MAVCHCLTDFYCILRFSHTKHPVTPPSFCNSQLNPLSEHICVKPGNAPHLQFLRGSTLAARFFQFSSPLPPQPFGRGFSTLLSRRGGKKFRACLEEMASPLPSPPSPGWAAEPPLHQLVCALGQRFVISVSSDRVKLPSSATSISSIFTRLPSVILQEPLKHFFFFWSQRSYESVEKCRKFRTLPLSLSLLQRVDLHA